jgi:hypothetical protein
MPDQVDPVTLTIIFVFNAAILGMLVKWFIPEMKKVVLELRD